MPEIPVKEIRRSDLHLPEIKRDDIMRSLSEIRLPEVDLSKIERPRFDLPDSVSKFEWPKFDLSAGDVGKAVVGAAAAAHIGRRRSRPRWPLAVGALIVGGLAAAAMLSNEALRSRIASSIVALRERIASMRSGGYELEVDREDPVAFAAAETAPIEPSRFADATTIDATGYPEGLGSDKENGTATLEEATTRD